MSKEKEEKQKALALTMEKIEKTYGRGTIMKLGDAPVIDIESISTGSIGIDLALGVGGLPKGRVVEVFGPESSGKTTLTLHAIAETQKQGGIAAFIDAEHAFDRFYAKKLGVDIDNLLISQPDCGEQAHARVLRGPAGDPGRRHRGLRAGAATPITDAGNRHGARRLP